MAENRLLHIYSQPYEHADARIVGSVSGLMALYDAIVKALGSTNGEAATPEADGCVFASDGEGYQVKIKVLPEEDYKDGKRTPEWAAYPPHYCNRGYDDDTHITN
jgi:hypothetical protein